MLSANKYYCLYAIRFTHTIIHLDEFNPSRKMDILVAMLRIVEHLGHASLEKEWVLWSTLDDP